MYKYMHSLIELKNNQIYEEAEAEAIQKQINAKILRCITNMKIKNYGGKVKLLKYFIFRVCNLCNNKTQ